MKLLLFSDLHCDVEAAERLVEMSAEADVVVGAGDFATVRRGLEKTIDALKRIDKPAVLTPGNSETDAELAAACRSWPSAIVLHGSGCEVDGVPFFGVGGGIPVTPFGDWSFDFSEEQAEKLLADCQQNGVLVTHSPPKGAVDVSSRGQSLGSTAIRAAIVRVQPRLVVCGHIHESSGKSAAVDSATVINAGPQGVFWKI